MIETRNNSGMSKIKDYFSFTFISLSIPAKRWLYLGRLSESAAATGLHGLLFCYFAILKALPSSVSLKMGHRCVYIPACGTGKGTRESMYPPSGCDPEVPTQVPLISQRLELTWPQLSRRLENIIFILDGHAPNKTNKQIKIKALTR